MCSRGIHPVCRPNTGSRRPDVRIRHFRHNGFAGYKYLAYKLTAACPYNEPDKGYLKFSGSLSPLPSAVRKQQGNTAIMRRFVSLFRLPALFGFTEAEVFR